MTAEKEKKGIHVSVSTGAVAIALSVLGAILFYMSYSTGYYTFGEMNSTKIVALVCLAIVLEVVGIIFAGKQSESLIVQLIPFAVTALLAGAIMMIIGDRVEGIGNCIVTDYDSGHGGEEAIYMSLAGAASMLAAMIYTIIGSFTKSGSRPAGNGKSIAVIVSGAVVGVAAIVAAMSLAGGFSSKGSAAPGGGAEASGSTSGTYAISFNQGNGNVDADVMPDYQFLSANMGGLARADGRFYIDVTLTLDGQGGYTIVSDSYVIDSGKRAEIGDPSGLGLVYKTTSEGTYTDNGEGSVITSAANHVKFELETDTYSEQMKDMMMIDLDGSDADGVYDSADYPVLLDYVPETVWTLGDGEVITYQRSALSGDFTISFNQANGNTDADVMPDYQFLSSNMGGLARADGRFYIDVKLTLDGGENYTLVSESYVIDSGKRVEIGDPSGLGLVYKTTSEGTYVDNGDGTVTTSPAEHVKFELATDTYSAQMKDMMQIDLDGSDEDGEYDSADYPVLLDYVPETIFTLDAATSEIITYEKVGGDEEEEEGEGEEEAPAGESLVVTSDDGSTTMTFNPDGTYVFTFEAYSIEETGTWKYEDGKLTVINPNGVEATAEGDPLKLHYVAAASDQLVGDYTINAADLSFAGAEEAAAAEPLVVTSDDGSTSMTFNPDGTCIFKFDAYSIEEAGTWTLADGKLTVVNPAGAEAVAEGDPLKLHYAAAASDQLVGDYTINAADLSFAGAEEAAAAEPLVVTSDDGSTSMTFNPDGTCVFKFDAYSIEEAGTWTLADGKLTVVNPAGAEAVAEGDPLKLHYAAAASDQLVGDFTVNAADLSFESAGAAEAEPLVVTSDDGSTTMTFNPDGTCVFKFDAYSIEEAGTWTLADGKLTVVNPAGAETAAEGDPLKLHYVAAASDQLVGDYTINAADLAG